MSTNQQAITIRNVTDAQLELMLLNGATHNLDWADIVTLLNNRGAKLELVTRMQELWEKTKIIAGEVVNVGRIIVMKLWEFIRANPNLVLGVAIGAALGALVNLIPFIGPWLAPIAMAIGATMGALAGHRLDKIEGGQTVSGSMFEDIITLAKRFFQLLGDIFVALRDEYFANGI
ncbi:MAG: hypothetical protein ACR2HF_13400 [Methylococcaceae bacterium]